MLGWGYRNLVVLNLDLRDLELEMFSDASKASQNEDAHPPITVTPTLKLAEVKTSIIHT